MGLQQSRETLERNVFNTRDDVRDVIARDETLQMDLSSIDNTVKLQSRMSDGNKRLVS